ADARHRALADADLLWQFWRKLEQLVPAETLLESVKSLVQRPSVPSHLEPELLDDIPDTPGVYLFYGENDALLYVGKSIHLRQRVLSHFSADHSCYKEMRMAREIRRLEWRETAGEIGALLHESQLIKDRQPVHNRALRRQRELCSWQLRATPEGWMQPAVAYASEQDFGSAANLYGLFHSRRKAENALRALAEIHELCLVMLGLETRAQSGKPCFAHQLRRCRGACVNKEPVERHQERLESALASLKVRTWPFEGAVGLLETGPDGRQDIHVVDNWCCLGTAHSEAEVRLLLDEAPARPAFDIDTYRILLRALSTGRVEMQPLSRKVQYYR
ncbi:MAG: ethanolamine utilization protein, partial [Noviherbaspirillum sp.]|nr:ethanolamine utilization protein [Noviherbaspirillum sp.]